MKLICSIYKSPKKDEMYLYVKKSTGLKSVPESLNAVFGDPIHVMDMLLSPEGKRLARVEVEEVMEALEEKGFFLQMPPTREPGYKEYG